VLACLGVYEILGYAPPPPSRVIVTGAGGRTGQLVFQKLLHSQLKHGPFEVIGVVRTEKSAKKLIRKYKCEIDQVVVADITRDMESRGLESADYMIICTSAVPQIIKRSLLKAMVSKMFRRTVRPPLFRWRGSDQHPEKVDYEGQKLQIDLAKRSGVKHVVIVSSMGGTDEGNFLNRIGKDAEGNGNGDILLWKRKAEKYLIASGLHYTIIHPGGLKDTPGGLNNLVLDVDDKLLQNKERQISREDVAELCVAALSVGSHKDVSFDCISTAPKDGDKIKSAEDVLEEFLAINKSCNYDI